MFNEGHVLTRIQRGGWCGLHCAHRATTALSWGLCEHRDHASCLATSLPSSLVPPSRNDTHAWFYCARRAGFPFLNIYSREWPRMPFTARIERALSECARSASKKGTWPLPHHPSVGARSGSKEPTWVPFLTFLLPAAANSIQRADRSRSRRGGNGLCAGDWAWR
jgi:hypothetical protein